MAAPGAERGIAAAPRRRALRAMLEDAKHLAAARRERVAVAASEATTQSRPMRWLRALAFNIAFFAVSLVLGIAGLPLLLAPRRTVMRGGRQWARCVLALLKAIVGLDGEIRGLEHLPPGAVIVAMKHQSTWDTL